MSISSFITGRNGHSHVNELVVTDEGAAKIIDAEHLIPDVGTASHRRFYSAVLGSTGADSGTVNQNTNTGTYYIESHSDYDIHLMRIVIIIADTAISHKNFGNVNPLASGWDLFVTERGADTYLIEKAKTGGQVIAKAGLHDGFGDGTTSFELSNWTGTEDAQCVAIPVGEYVPGGVRIGRGTKDRITSTFADDLTGLTEFTVRALGYRHYP